MIMSKKTLLHLSCKMLSRIGEDQKDHLPGTRARLEGRLISLSFIFDSEGVSSPSELSFVSSSNSTLFGP